MDGNNASWNSLKEIRNNTTLVSTLIEPYPDTVFGLIMCLMAQHYRHSVTVVLHGGAHRGRKRGGRRRGGISESRARRSK